VSATAFTPSKSITSATTEVASPPAPYLSYQRVESFFAAGGDHNLGALLSEPQGRLAAYAARGSHQRDDLSLDWFQLHRFILSGSCSAGEPQGDRAPHSAFVAAELVIYAVHPAELAEGVETFDRWRRTIGHVPGAGDIERAALEVEAFEKSLVRLLGLGCHVGKQGAGVTLLIQSREDDA